MKVVFLLLAAVGLSCGAAIDAQPKDLNQDLQDFINLLPIEKILDIIYTNIQDPEMQAVIEYIFSDEFKALVLEVESISEYDTVISYLDHAGLPVQAWISWLHELIGLSRHGRVSSSKSLSSAVQEILDILPIEEIKALKNEKMQTSPEFKELIEKLDSPIFRSFVQALKDNRRIQEIVARLYAVGVDVNIFIQLLKDIFGFSY